jgi:Leucine-rich repeat (LRR) protein
MKLEQLKELNLEDNFITELPKDLSKIFPSLENLNLNGNNVDNAFEDTVAAI